MSENDASRLLLITTLERLRVSASLLQQNAEGCAINHYGEDFSLFGMPGWLLDTKKDIDAAASVISEIIGLSAPQKATSSAKLYEAAVARDIVSEVKIP